MLKKTLSLYILNYFRFFARLQLKKNPQATIVGITGSAGKTSTRLAIVHVLKNRGVVKHSFHANSQSGIPLNILGLSPKNYSLIDWLRLIVSAPIQLLLNWEHFDYYVVEMGIDGPSYPNNMAYLLSILRPDVAIVLNAGLVHAAAFDHLVKDKNPLRRSEKLIHLIAKEKMQLAKSLPKSGVAIYNLDQKDLVLQARDISSRKLTFGKSAKADIQILGHYHYLYQGIKYELQLSDVFSPEYEYTFAASLAALISLGISPSISLPLLTQYKSPSGRMRLFPGKHNTTIIDSSYNASPATMLEALKNLKNLSARKHKIAVLGDMRELGQSDKLAHKKLADWVATYADEAILFGELTKLYTLPVLAAKKFPVTHFSSMAKLVSHLQLTLHPGSYILVKGSQNTIFLERAVEAILKNPQDAARLCRRGKYWDKLRLKAS